jgi:hypothetical protein
MKSKKAVDQTWEEWMEKELLDPGEASEILALRIDDELFKEVVDDWEIELQV